MNFTILILCKMHWSGRIPMSIRLNEIPVGNSGTTYLLVVRLSCFHRILQAPFFDFLTVLRLWLLSCCDEAYWGEDGKGRK
jgi:hypothetical protein